MTRFIAYLNNHRLICAYPSVLVGKLIKFEILSDRSVLKISLKHATSVRRQAR